MWCETSSPRPGWEAGGGWHAGATQAQLARVGRRTTAMQAACSRGLRRCGAGHGEERTSNIRSMLVTLEVSKLSGWLNADARRNIMYMVVTLEVSQLDMSALTFFKPLKR